MSSFSDDFNRADGGLGANYFVPVGSAGVVSNTAQSLATSIAIVVVTAAGNVADGSIEVTYGANDSSQFSQLSARNDGAGNFVYVETFGGTTYLYESVSGVPALLDSVASAPGPGDTLKLNFNGTALSVDLNGSPILSGTTSITSANLLVFILSPSGASGDVSIDDLVIVDAGGGITADAADTNTPTDSAVSVTQRLSVGTDTNSPTDSAVSITSRLSVGVDTNTPTDSAVSISQRLSVAADTNTPTDSAVSGVVSTCVAADTNTPTDSAEAAVGFPAEAADTNTPTDSAVSITARLSVAEDTNTPTDSAEGGVVNTCVAADTNTPTDSAEAGAQLPSVASDTNIPTDSAVASNVPAGVSAGVDTNTPTDSAVSITTRTAMAEDFNTPSDSAICISSGGGSVYKYIDGTAFDRYGRMMTVPLGISDPLPATARYIMGIAHSQNGRRYVTRWPGSIIKHIDGYALRDDGVQVVAPDADIDGALAGIPVTYRRETVVSDNYPSKAVGGWGLDAAGRLTVTNHGA